MFQIDGLELRFSTDIADVIELLDSTDGILASFLNTYLLQKKTETVIVKEDELQKYLKEETVNTSVDSLAWWRMNATRFPTVSGYARDVLAIQATSVPSESLFSKAGNVVNKKRCRLSPKTVNAILCMQSWLKLGVTFNFAKAELESLAEEDE